MTANATTTAAVGIASRRSARPGPAEECRPSATPARRQPEPRPAGQGQADQTPSADPIQLLRSHAESIASRGLQHYLFLRWVGYDHCILLLRPPGRFSLFPFMSLK